MHRTGQFWPAQSDPRAPVRCNTTDFLLKHSTGYPVTDTIRPICRYPAQPYIIDGNYCCLGPRPAVPSAPLIQYKFRHFIDRKIAVNAKIAHNSAHYSLVNAHFTPQIYSLCTVCLATADDSHEKLMSLLLQYCCFCAEGRGLAFMGLIRADKVVAHPRERLARTAYILMDTNWGVLS